jgi:hypothetical protein
MTEVIYIAIGETEDSTVTLEDANGAINLDGATVLFLVNGLEKECAVTDAEDGEVVIDWLVDDFDKQGDYKGYFWVTKASEATLRVPKPGDVIVKVQAGRVVEDG